MMLCFQAAHVPRHAWQMPCHGSAGTDNVHAQHMQDNTCMLSADASQAGTIRLPASQLVSSFLPGGATAGSLCRWLPEQHELAAAERGRSLHQQLPGRRQQRPVQLWHLCEPLHTPTSFSTAAGTGVQRMAGRLLCTPWLKPCRLYLSGAPISQHSQTIFMTQS